MPFPWPDSARPKALCPSVRGRLIVRKRVRNYGDPGHNAGRQNNTDTLWQTGGMSRLIIDVRTPAEYANRHIEGAINVDCNAPDFDARIAAFPPRHEYVVYCNAGGRAGRAAARMRIMGFPDVTSYGIIGASVATGQPVVYQPSG